MKHEISLILFSTFFLLTGCSKKTGVDIKEWDTFQDQFFRVAFAYPKDWYVVREPNRVLMYNSVDVADKFFTRDPYKPDGVQIIVGSERSDTIQNYAKYIEDFKDTKTAEGFTIKEFSDTKIEDLSAKKVIFSGAYDENTKIKSVRVATLKDSTIYYVQYSAFNNLFEPYQLVFDSVMATLMLPKKIVVEKGVNPAIPSTQVERYADAYMQLEYPANFGSIDMPKKGEVLSQVRFQGKLEGNRRDCTIDIDIRPAKKLTLKKVVEQNSKKINATSKGSTTIGTEEATFFNETPQRNIERRTYFIVKNDKFIRVILTYYTPMKKDFLPAFEKVVASIRLK